MQENVEYLETEDYAFFLANSEIPPIELGLKILFP